MVSNKLKIITVDGIDYIVMYYYRLDTEYDTIKKMKNKNNSDKIIKDINNNIYLLCNEIKNASFKEL